MIIAALLLLCGFNQEATTTPVETKSVFVLYHREQSIVPLSPDDPISARLDTTLSMKVAGPIALRIEARDLPIIGKRFVSGQRLWVVQFGAKDAYAVLVNDSGDIFSLIPKDGELIADDRIRPKTAKLTPLPR